MSISNFVQELRKFLSMRLGGISEMSGIIYTATKIDRIIGLYLANCISISIVC